MWSTCNRYLNKGFSQVTEHEAGEEIASNLDVLITNAVENFSKNCGGRPPERILILRDGVGDSQKRIVMKNEIIQI